MKLDIVGKDIFSGGTGERIKFTVRADSHIMKVLSSLYEHPEKAMVREYLTNMYDAYVALKSVNPTADFIPPVLSLPTNLSPFLEFRDYGIGMSVQTVMEVFTQYGNSTKNGNNDEVGGFGLGAKTAFCYNGGQTWYIETRYNGKVYRFAAFLDENQIPTLTPMSTEDTTDHNGVTVKIPVVRKDIASIYDAADELVPYFPIPLTVENRDIPPAKYSIKTDTWGINAVSRTNSHWNYYSVRVIVGSVPYEFDLTNIGRSKFPDKLPYASMEFYLPVGSVDIVPSRDSLQVTEKTKAAVKTAIDKMIVELPAAVTKGIDAEPDIASAATKLNDILKSFSYEYSYEISSGNATSTFLNGFLKATYRGQPIISHVDNKGEYSREYRDTFVGVTHKVSALPFKADHVNVYGRLTTSKSDIHELRVDTLTLNNVNTFVILNDGVRNPVRIGKAFGDEKFIHRSHSGRKVRYGHKVGYVVMITTDKSPEAMAKILNIPVDWIGVASKLKGSLKLSSVSSLSADNIYKMDGRGKFQARVRVPDDADAPHYYVPVFKDGHRFTSTVPANHALNMADILAGHLKKPDGVDIYGVKESEVADLDTTLWVRADVAVKKIIEDSLQNDIGRWLTTYTMGYNNVMHSNALAALRWFKKQGTNKLGADAVRLVNECDKAHKASQPPLPFTEDIMGYLKIDYKKYVRQSSQFYDFEGELKNILSKHPLLKFIADSRASYYGNVEDTLNQNKKFVLDTL